MAIPPDQQAHRDALGKAVTVWMKRNGWSQQTFHDWATAAGSEGPWNSQMSLYSRGRLDPKSQFWVSIGRFNAAVASQDFPYVTNRNLRDRLIDAQPFLNAHGTPASATDLFSMFIGEQPIAEDYLAPEPLPVLTEADAKGISDMCRDTFRRIATAEMLNPRDAWEALKPHCTMLNATELDRFREVLAGWSDWDAEEAMSLSVPGELGRPAQALHDWGGDIPTVSPISLRKG
jgi:hypothetical protein